MDDDSLPLTGKNRRKKLARLPNTIIKMSVKTAAKSKISDDAHSQWVKFRNETADEIFKVLTELRGPALKIGQMLSVLEVGFPEDVMRPYRDKLRLLQDSVPPIPFNVVNKLLLKSMGDDYRYLTYISESPVAAASIGQVHRATYKGYDVAVKIQYPGIDVSIRDDIKLLRKYSRIFAFFQSKSDTLSLIDEIEDSLLSEIDYLNEARLQNQAHQAFKGENWVIIPRVLNVYDKIIISEYIEATSLSTIIDSDNQVLKNNIALLLARFHFASPFYCNFLHADPHPGNFKVTNDGKLVVLDFGACKALEGGFPEPLVRMLSYAINNKSQELYTSFLKLGFIKDGVSVDPRLLLDFLAPLVAALRDDVFTYSREWLMSENERIGDPRNPTSNLGFSLTLPSEYLLIHRVTLGMTGIFAQLNATNRFRAEALRFYPMLDTFE